MKHPERRDKIQTYKTIESELYRLGFSGKEVNERAHELLGTPVVPKLAETVFANGHVLKWRNLVRKLLK